MTVHRLHAIDIPYGAIGAGPLPSQLAPYSAFHTGIWSSSIPHSSKDFLLFGHQPRCRPQFISRQEALSLSLSSVAEMERRKRSWWLIALTLTIHFSQALSLSAHRQHQHRHQLRSSPSTVTADSSPLVDPAEAGFAFLRARDQQPVVDYTCSASRACGNKACCGER